MKEQLLNFIDSLKSDRKILSFDEAETKNGVVLRLLSILGWYIFNIDEVRPEYSVGSGRVDYSLRIDSTDKVFIEVKKTDEELEKHQEQLLRYSFGEGVKLAILTNGVAWWFYLPLQERSWEQRKFYTIDIIQQESEDIASRFIDFLLKENINSGKAVENAETVYRGQQKQNRLKETIPEAWNKIVSEPDKSLIDSINEITEKLCGYKAENKLIEHFISSHKEQFLISNFRPPIRRPEPVRRERIKPKSSFRLQFNFIGKSITAFTFKGSRYEIRYWRELLIKLCEALVATHGNEFSKVLLLKGSKNAYFTYNENEVRAPRKISNTRIYAETSFSANKTVKICYRLLSEFGYSKSDLKIEAH